MKLEMLVAPVTPEARQAVEDAWVAILRAELAARARDDRARELTPRADVDDRRAVEVPDGR